MLTLIGVVLWFAFCIAIAIRANHRNRWPFGWFLLSFFFSPLVAICLLLILPARDDYSAAGWLDADTIEGRKTAGMVATLTAAVFIIMVVVLAAITTARAAEPLDIRSPAFGFADIRKITGTLSENELRFKRDYAGRPFASVGPFSRVTTMIFPANQWLIEIGKGPGLGNVHCHFPTGSPALVPAIEWKRGMAIKVTGTVRGQSLIGDLTLDNCIFEPVAKTAGRK